MVDFQERDTRRATGTSGEKPDDDDVTPDDEREHGEGHEEPRHHDHDVETIGAAVVTVSSSRTVDDDPSGDAICESVRDDGHEVVTRELLADDLDGIQRTIDNTVGRSDVDVVITTGGTGVTPDDVTIEAVRPLFRKELPGFGELFRRRSEEEIGTRVIATRATAGVAESAAVFCLPGSENAAKLGVELVLAEAGHIVGLSRRGQDAE